jgi:hypothetical protein
MGARSGGFSIAAAASIINCKSDHGVFSMTVNGSL